MKYRVKYLACDFSKTDSNGHKSFDKQSFIDYINKPETKTRIKGKKMVGAISHLWRDKFEDSEHPSVSDQSDFLLANNAACNCIVDMIIEDGKLYITIETLPTEPGIMLAKLFDIGYDMEVSMSTTLDIGADDKYHIVEVHGLDMTNSPAFATKLVSKSKED